MFKLKIVEAVRDDQIGQVVSLLRDYFLWLRRRYVKEMPILDTVGFHQVLEHELAELGVRYGAPRGGILFAEADNCTAGCIMFRPLGDDICEMRRLFVHPAYKGNGIASALVARLTEMAVERGYTTIRLEVGPRQEEAVALFRDAGLKHIEPYCDPSYVFRDQMLFMEADARVAMEASARLAHRHRTASAA